MNNLPQILLFQATDPAKVKQRLLRFREAFLRMGPYREFAIVSYTPGATTAVHKVVLNGIEIDHYVFGPDAIDTLGYPHKGAARPFKLIPGNGSSRTTSNILATSMTCSPGWMGALATCWPLTWRMATMPGPTRRCCARRTATSRHPKAGWCS